MSGKNILKQKQGETLVEVMVSLVIVLLSIGAFSLCAIISGRINARVSERDSKMYQSVGEAESRKGTPASGKVKIFIKGTTDEMEVSVDIYGTDQKTFSYEKDEEVTPP